MSGYYTRLGSNVWTWEPFASLDDDSARILWMALYTSTAAKRIVPGLWHGSITAMAEAAHMPTDRALRALDVLLERELVEFDQKHSVLRLTMLPDAGESPANGNVIRGWYKRFKSVPACQVRDAHVTTLAWLMNEWSRENDGKPISEKHREAWKETFGHIVVPAPRRRGVRRLVESDTSTAVQPSLFDAPQSQASDVTDDRSGTVPMRSDGRSVDNSDVLHQLKEIRDSETVSKPFPNGSDQDQDPDQDLDLLLGGERPERIADESAISVPRTTTKPRLVLLPAATDATTAELLARLAAPGKYPAAVRESAQDALGATIRGLEAGGMGPAEVAMVADWIAQPSYRQVIEQIGGDPRTRLSVWVAGRGNVIGALHAAQHHERELADHQAMLAEATKTLGYQ